MKRRSFFASLTACVAASAIQVFGLTFPRFRQRKFAVDAWFAADAARVMGLISEKSASSPFSQLIQKGVMPEGLGYEPPAIQP